MHSRWYENRLLLPLVIIFLCVTYLIFFPHAFMLKWDDLDTINENTPAFGVLAIRDGKVLIKEVRGCAEFQQYRCVRAANINTRFPILSLTKHFTAAILLMLEEEGLISIEDEVTKYLPDFADRISGVKIKHLIFHTSGINYNEATQKAMDNASDIATITPSTNRIITEQITLENLHKIGHIKPHGVEYSYSNIGYCLLTAVIEKVTGTTYENYIQQNIFDKHGMHRAFMATSLDKHSNYTLPYKGWPLYKDTQWMKYIRPSGSGGIFMSLDDYIKWIEAFDKQKIFKHSATMEKFLSIGKYEDGQDVTAPMTNYAPSSKYGFGMNHFTIDSLSGQHDVIAHRGNLPGSAAYFIKIPSRRSWVVYFNNAEAYPNMNSMIDILLFQRAA